MAGRVFHRLHPLDVLNPLRSEEEAFRLLLYALVVIVLIAAVILILRAVL